MPSLRKQKEPQEPEENVSKKTLAMRKYREKLKRQHEHQYKEMKEKDKLRKQVAREHEKKSRKQSTYKTEKARKKWREQKMKYRNKVKQSNATEGVSKRSETETDTASCEKKRIQRFNLKIKSQKKQMAVQRTKRWRLRIKYYNENAHNNENPVASEMETEPSTSTCNKDQPPFQNRMSEHRALRRAKSALPTTPNRKARIIQKLIHSPVTQKHLKAKGLLMTNKTRRKLEMGKVVLKSLKDKLKSVKQKGTLQREKRAAYKNIVNAVLDKTVTKYHKFGSALATYLRIRKASVRKQSDWWKPQQRATRKDRLGIEVQELVHDFYVSPSVSRVSPNKKDVITIDGEKTQVHVMNMTLKEAFDLFKLENPEVKIGLSSFKALKPKQVKIVKETSHRSCLCQICCNLALKIDCLKKYAEQNEKDKLKEQMIGMTKRKIADMTVCSYSELPSNECLQGTCQKCGPSLLQKHLELDLKANETIQWYKWEGIQVTDDKSKVKRVTSCVSKTTTMKEFLSQMQDDVKRYTPHIFRANWQHKQLQRCLDNLQPGQLVMLMDFSENYRCRFQNEAQNAYFDQQQVTVHPFMTYYLEEIENNGPENASSKNLVKHAVIAISNDTKHDAFSVYQFEKGAMAVLSRETEVKEVIKYSDGCAAQYKGKNSFAHLSKSDVPTSRNYFETSHGKSPCDGLGAVIKQACFNAVKSEKAVIGNAEDAFKFCKNKLEHNKIVRKGNEQYRSKRDIIFVERQEINREEFGVKTLVGTRSIHAARSVNRPFTVDAKNLSCFCDPCTKDATPCENGQYVTPWVRHDLTPAPIRQVAVADSIVTPGSGDSSIACSVQPSHDMEEIEIGCYVLARITSRKQRKGAKVEQDFVARILEMDGEEYKMTYMLEKSIKGKKYYYWPQQEDLSWEDASCVVKVLQEPQLSDKSTNRNLLFTVSML